MTFAQFGPQAMTGVGMNLAAFLRRIFEAYHLPDPWELVAPNAEEMQEQQRQAEVAKTNPFYAEQARAHGQIAASRESADQQTVQKLLDAAMALGQPPNRPGNTQ